MVRLLTRKIKSVAPPPAPPIRSHRIYGIPLDREKHPALAQLLDEAKPPTERSLELITADTIQNCREQYLREVRHLEYGQLIAKYNIDPLDILVWQGVRGFQGPQDHLQAIRLGEYKGIMPADLREAVFIAGIAGTIVNTLIEKNVITQFVETLKKDQQYLLRIIAQTYQRQGPSFLKTISQKSI